LHKKIAEMQDIVTSMRLVPLAATFQKLHRVVRDMSKRQNKVISLELFGEEIELDKNIIEQLSDPLMHLVRNAVDHGIEDSEARLANGKERRGVITLGAYGKRGEVNIVVKDDGRGLDTKKILEKAKQNNLLPVSESQLTEKEIYSLIFLPGFSTNESITEFSGRGVGLDVVTQNISSVGGTLSVESEKNKGTAITIKIPIRPVK
ncbi:MAG: ATP-binding protein, partial [Eubacteriales bacterium]